MKIPRLARKGKAFYYVTSTAPRRWIPLGSDYAAALAKWAELEARPQASTIASLWARFRAERQDIRPNTRRSYERAVALLQVPEDARR
jgi:hypothetical protein